MSVIGPRLAFGFGFLLQAVCLFAGAQPCVGCRWGGRFAVQVKVGTGLRIPEADHLVVSALARGFEVVGGEHGRAGGLG